jgi:hypothetical protein
MTDALTRYFMLTSRDGVTWTHQGDILARNRDQAIRDYFVAEEGVQYNAVPSSSWRPVALATRTVIKETIALTAVSLPDPGWSDVIPGQIDIEEAVAEVEASGYVEIGSPAAA